MHLSRSTRVDLRGGTPLLELRVGAADTALLYEGAPVALVGPDPDDTLGAILVRAHSLRALDAALPALLLRAETSLVDTLRPLLDLVGAGVWQLEELAAEVEEAVDAPASGRAIEWLGLHHVGAEEAVLIATVPADLVGEERIRASQRRIRAGERPAVVALGALDVDTAFVVAGHAALHAYRREGMSPAMVHLLAQDPPHLSTEHAAELLAEAYVHIGEVTASWYRQVRAGPAAEAS